MGINCYNFHGHGKKGVKLMKFVMSFLGVIFTPLFAFAAKIEGYTQLEYLDTTGKEWFDTGLKVNGDYNVKAKLQAFALGYSPKDSKLLGNAAPKYAMYGGGDAVQEKEYASVLVCYGANWAPGVMTRYNDYNRIDHSYDGNSCKPVKYTYSRGTSFYLRWGAPETADSGLIWAGGAPPIAKFVSTNNFYIAAVNTPGLDARPGVLRIWYFQIIDGANSNKLLRDYIPVRRNSDGEVGLYDTVTKEFYGNVSGEGSVKAGPLKVEEWVVDDSGLFNYSAEWTISGYSGSSTLSGVPVLLRLSPETVKGFSYRQYLSQGKNIAFSSKEDFSDRLPYEIEKWDTSGESLIWVKVPSISGKDTKIYMRWGRMEPAINLPSTEVWSDYLGVWHMNNYDEEKGAIDSSPYARHAKIVSSDGSAPTVPTQVDGKAGFGLQTAANTRFEAASLQKFYDDSIYDDMPPYFTVSIWAKKIGTYEGYEDVIGSFGGPTGQRYGWVLEHGSRSTDNINFYYGKKTTASASKSGGAPSIGNWNYHTITFNGRDLYIYRNGGDYTSSKSQLDSTGMGGIDKPLSILGPNCKMSAVGDEVRISKTVLSADRIKADYQMMTVSDFVVCTLVKTLREPGFRIMVR